MVCMEVEFKKTSIASWFNINAKTVDLWIRKEREESNLAPKKGKVNLEKKIIDYVKDHPLTKGTEIKQVNVNCSISTIKRNRYI